MCGTSKPLLPVLLLLFLVMALFVTWGAAALWRATAVLCRLQLNNVQQIQASGQNAFAAILGDGSVVTWGDAVLWWRQQLLCRAS